MPIPVKTTADRFTFETFGPLLESDVHVASTGDGRFHLTYTGAPAAGNPDVYGLRRSAASDLTQPRIFSNSSTIDEQDIASSTFSSGQLAVFVWAQRPDAGGGWDIYAEITAGRGLSIEDVKRPFAIVATADDTTRPQVVTLDGARFAVAWLNGTTGRVEMSVFDGDGSIVSSPAIEVVSSGVPQPGVDLGMTALAGGDFVISWSQAGQARYRIYDRAGDPVTVELDVNPGTLVEGATSAEALADGGFVMAWIDGGVVSARVFDTDGSAVTTPFTIFGSSDVDSSVKVTALLDGRFMAVVNSGAEIVGRVFFANGMPDGAQFTVNTVATGTQSQPTLDTLLDGRVVVAWITTEDGDPDIKLCIYDPREGTVYITGTGVSDELIGSAFPDQLAGGAGDDALNGGAGGDQLTGGSGDDSLDGGDGNDFMLGEAGADFMRGGAGQNTMYGGVGRDEVRGGDDNDYLVGNAGGDAMYGFLGADVMIGDEEGGAGSGSDYISGGGGNDLIFGCGGNDTILGDNNGGTGVGADTLYGMDGDDTIYGGLGADLIYGGVGNDTLYGNEDGDYIVGELGNDFLEGGAGNDVLIGDNAGGSGTGDDTINGGAGNDQIYLGAGGDAVRFDQAGAANADQVFNFTSGNDKIALNYGAFSPADQGGFVVRFVGGPGAVANTAGATILYDTNTGSLLYDADGNGAGAAVIIATFSNVPTLAAGDLVFY